MRICAREGCENEVTGRVDKKFCSENCGKKAWVYARDDHKAYWREQKAAQRAARPEVWRTYNATWTAANPEKVREYRRKYDAKRARATAKAKGKVFVPRFPEASV